MSAEFLLKISPSQSCVMGFCLWPFLHSHLYEPTEFTQVPPPHTPGIAIHSFTSKIKTKLLLWTMILIEAAVIDCPYWDSRCWFATYLDRSLSVGLGWIRVCMGRAGQDTAHRGYPRLYPQSHNTDSWYKPTQSADPDTCCPRAG